MQLIFWAGGINGEGSSKVAFKLMKALIGNYEKGLISNIESLD